MLAQDGVEGLQARNLADEWIDVPPADNTLAVNFGQLLERWTAGRVRATRHRGDRAQTGALLDPVLL
ncbi:2OG-Fe(II) oxygenase family protein [Mesorhizobium atlanticum]